jgi:predicted nucleotidyltransferase
LVNDIVKLTLLAAVHDDVVPVGTAEHLFGKENVDEAVRSGRVEVEEGFLGKGSRSLARKKRRISEGKMEKARSLLRHLEKIPWVCYAGVTGSVSHGSASAEDDIDVFVVAAHNRLWLTRLAEQVLYRMMGVRRRYGDKNVSDRICINYYTSAGDLDLSCNGTSRFMSALEIAMMEPVVHPEFFGRILYENRWIRKYFPGVSEGSPGRRSDNKLGPFSRVADILDLLCMKVWIAYMKALRHPADKVIIERNTIQFFDRDVWKRKEREWKRLLELYDMG